MITRRNIRIKVMQAIYTSIQCPPTNLHNQLQKEVKNSLEKTKELYFYLTKTLVNVCYLAQRESLRRAGKYVPSAEDLSINTKLAGNTIIKTIMECEDYKAYNKTIKFNEMVDYDMIKQMYNTLLKTPEYLTYIANKNRNPQEEKEILNFIVSDIIFPSEFFEENTDNFFTNWDDDADMLRTILLAMIGKVDRFTISGLVGAEKNNFALELATAYASKVDYLEKLYVPKLKNWDEGRIAILDKIIITMGLAEFLYFETIPVRVTMNEYIDLAKNYSTKQSGQFINGILDNIYKDLEANKQIVKKQLIKS